MWSRLVLFGLIGLAPAASVLSQSSSDTVDSFLIKGVAADAKGPLVGKTLLVMPVDAKSGKAVIRYPSAQATFGTARSRASATDKWTFMYKDEPDDAHTGQRLNPRVTTDAKGAFAVAVPRSLFKETPRCAHGCTTFKAGVLGLAAFDDLVSAFEVKLVTYDASASTVDAGRVVFEPARDPEQ